MSTLINLNSESNCTRLNLTYKEPRIATTQIELKAQLDFILSITEKTNQVTQSVKEIREYYQQIKQVSAALDSKNEAENKLINAGKSLKKGLK